MTVSITSDYFILDPNEKISEKLLAKGTGKPFRWEAKKIGYGLEITQSGEIKGKIRTIFFALFLTGREYSFRVKVYDSNGRSDAKIITLYFKLKTSLWMCGLNDKGQLGDGTTINRSSPVQTIIGGNDWHSVSTRNGATAAIKNDGTLWTWGNNTYGQLNDGTFNHRSIPVKYYDTDDNHYWAKVSVGGKHAAGIYIFEDRIDFEDRRRIDIILPSFYTTLMVWGDNSFGQYGLNHTINVLGGSSLPARMPAWIDVVCGENHILGLKSDGTLWAWGDNQYGQLGDGTTISRSSPVQVGLGNFNWRMLAKKAQNHSSGVASENNTAAPATYYWGLNNKGQLGDGTKINRSYPVKPKLTERAFNFFPALSENNSTLSLVYGRQPVDGGLAGFGNNCYGEFGNNTTDCSGIPNPAITIPTFINNVDMKFKEVIAGKSIALLRYNDHLGDLSKNLHVYTWGLNTYGQLGDNTTINKSSPVQTVMSNTYWKTCDMGDHNFAGIKYNI